MLPILFLMGGTFTRNGQSTSSQRITTHKLVDLLFLVKTFSVEGNKNPRTVATQVCLTKNIFLGTQHSQKHVLCSCNKLYIISVYQ